jgi:tetratricopeptide (TPR) repeat protein
MAIFRNDYARAEKSLKHAIAQNPTHGEAIMALADLLRGQKRYQQATMYYQRAEPLPGLEERALLGRAQSEIEQRNYDTALNILGTVVRNNPDRTDLRASMHSLRNLVRNRP